MPKKISILVITATLVLSACSPASAPRSASAPSIPQFTPTFAPPPTETPVPTAMPTEILVPTATATATEPPRGLAIEPRASSISHIPPGVYVAAIMIDPIQARSDQAPEFIVTFLNSTGNPQTFRWFVKIYADQPHSFGETPKLDTAILPGSVVLRANPQWKTRTFFNCLWFTARVFWVDHENQVREFLKPDATNPGTGFSVCP